MNASAPFVSDSVADYDDVLGWLFRHLKPDAMSVFLDCGEAPDLCVTLICDLFWVTLDELRSDLRKHWGKP